MPKFKPELFEVKPETDPTSIFLGKLVSSISESRIPSSHCDGPQGGREPNDKYELLSMLNELILASFEIDPLITRKDLFMYLHAYFSMKLKTLLPSDISEAELEKEIYAFDTAIYVALGVIKLGNTARCGPSWRTKKNPLWSKCFICGPHKIFSDLN
jgi:hypothetical protein